MRNITPHLWYDSEAVEAAELYASALPDSKVNNVSTIHDTPSGDTDIVSFELCGQPFMSISAGPLFKFTPAISFAIACETKEEVDDIWAKLSPAGEVMMPLDTYPFSERFGWTSDRFGLSWQVMHAGGRPIGQRITPMLMFVGDVCGKAEDAARSYASLFPDSAIGDVNRHGGGGPDAEGTIQYATVNLAGYQVAVMDSALGHDFTFNEAISFIVTCETQSEIDHYWHGLSAVPEAERCGWLKDAYGVSWQIVPTAMEEMVSSGTKEQISRVTEAFLPMKKLDIATLREAYEGSGA